MRKECDAFSRRSRQKCHGPAVTGSSKCRMHGGKSLSGLGSGTFKHGRYSHDLPTRLALRYEAAAHDPELLTLRDEVAVVEARLVDLLTRVDSGESGSAWRAARHAYAQFRDSSSDVDRARYWLAELDRIIARGQADYAAWGEIGRLMDRKRRLSESERKYLVEQQQTMTYDEVRLFFQALFQAVNQHVADRDVRAAIQEQFARLVNRPEPPLNGGTMKNSK